MVTRRRDEGFKRIEGHRDGGTERWIDGVTRRRDEGYNRIEG